MREIQHSSVGVQHEFRREATGDRRACVVVGTSLQETPDSLASFREPRADG